MTDASSSGAPRTERGSLPRLHVVTDDEVLARDGWVAAARRVLEAGGPRVALHLRGPGTGGAALFGLARSLSPVAESTGARLFVNDRADVALAAGISDVHLGARSLPVGDVRALLGSGGCIGVSAHSAEGVRHAQAEGADFAFLGSIHPTPSHPGRPGMGLDGLREAVPLAGGMPLLGIGGISVEQTEPLVGNGAHGVAVLRAIWDGRDPGAAAATFIEVIEDAIDE